MNLTLLPRPRVAVPIAGARSERVPAIRLSGLSKRFGTGESAVEAISRLDLEVAAGEFVCLVGASGCGKSTLLNLISGLDRPTEGAVKVAPGHRATLIFQDAALFPWLTAVENVDLALRLRGAARGARRRRALELLRQVRLDGFADKRPHELSGGMRQRVALARALAQEADILLMDEPFGALDAMTRDHLHDEIERLWQESRLTVVFVTHNVRESVRLGDRVVLLASRPGRVRAEYAVPFARPRRIESAEVSTLAAEIRERLGAEGEDSGAG